MPQIEQNNFPTAQLHCVRWKYHHSNLQIMFAQLLKSEKYCDVTLACEGKSLRAHKIILSACSSYFDTIFTLHEDKEPIIILKDVRFEDVRSLVEFMYKGKVNVESSQLNSLLQTAELLQIKGLAAASWRPEGENGSWRTVDTQQESEEPNGQELYRRPQISNRKRQSESSVPHGFSTNPKVAHLAQSEGSSESGDDVSSKSGDDVDDSLLAMWDTRSEKDVYADNLPHSTYTPFIGASTVCAEQESSGAPKTQPSLMDVVPLNTYIQQGGSRPHFWETLPTKRVMEAIKHKEIEMKVGAQMLGVSYGTLYTRYRDTFGCLKNPYRYRDFWREPRSTEVILKLQRKELSMFKAAELLNVTVTTLANYLATKSKEDEEETDDDSGCVKNETIYEPTIILDC